jgi:hypothetical protein
MTLVRIPLEYSKGTSQVIFQLGICLLSILASQWAAQVNWQHINLNHHNHGLLTPLDMFQKSSNGHGRRQQALILDLGGPPGVSSNAAAVEIVSVLDSSSSSSKMSHVQVEVAKHKETLQKPTVEEGPVTVVWNQRPSSDNTTFPIFNMGLTRSGINTLWSFFQNLGYFTQYRSNAWSMQRR